jgi:hypothetical protein
MGDGARGIETEEPAIGPRGAVLAGERGDCELAYTARR